MWGCNGIFQLKFHPLPDVRIIYNFTHSSRICDTSIISLLFSVDCHIADVARVLLKLALGWMDYSFEPYVLKSKLWNRIPSFFKYSKLKWKKNLLEYI